MKSRRHLKSNSPVKNPQNKVPEKSGQIAPAAAENSGQLSPAAGIAPAPPRAGRLSVTGNASAKWFADQIQEFMRSARIKFGENNYKSIQRLCNGNNVKKVTLQQSLEGIVDLTVKEFGAKESRKVRTSWDELAGSAGRLGITMPRSPGVGDSEMDAPKTVREMMRVFTGEFSAGGEIDNQPAVKSNLILGAIIPNLLTEPFFRRLGEELYRLAASRGVTLHGISDGRDISTPREAMGLCQDLRELKCAGVFFVPFESCGGAKNQNAAIAQELAGTGGAKVVLLDRELDRFPEKNGYDVVRLDNLAAGQKLIEHLLPKIPKKTPKLMFIHRPTYAYSIELRLMGLNAGLLRNNRKAIKATVCDTSSARALRNLNLGAYDAVICANDSIASDVDSFLTESELTRRPLLAGFDRLWPERNWISVPQPIAHITQAAWMIMLMRVRLRPPVDNDFPATTVLIQPNEIFDMNQ